MLELKDKKRTVDVIGDVVRVMLIATSAEGEATPCDDGKGAARAKAMTPERKAEIVKQSAEKRWRQD